MHKYDTSLKPLTHKNKAKPGQKQHLRPESQQWSGSRALSAAAHHNQSLGVDKMTLSI